MSSSSQDDSKRGEAWSEAEVLATVGAYFDMYDDIMSNREINKSRVYEGLASRFPARSKKAFERKFQNVSSCLYRLGLEWIEGLLPATNFQGLLMEAVEQKILERAEPLAQFAERAVGPPVEPEGVGVFVPAPASPDVSHCDYRSPVARKIDYAAREARNRSLGLAGEEWVVRLEKAMLRAAGHEDLAHRVSHVSQTLGDGLGFDVESFDHQSREPRLIEVKTTRAGELAPFFVTRNEVDVSEARAEVYRLYRVHAFGRRARVYVLKGNLAVACRLDVASYRAVPMIA